MALLFKTTLLPYTKIARNFLKIPYFLASSSRLVGNYEGDGKTTVTILNREHKDLILIDSYSDFGFRLNNGIFVVGPLATFPRTILQWNVNSTEEMTPESFSLFSLLEPKIDILVIGTGDKKTLPEKHVLQFLNSKNISTEIFSTEQACAIFNFLNCEGRCVAGAFIPPTALLAYPDELKIVHETDAADQLIDIKIKDRKIIE